MNQHYLFLPALANVKLNFAYLLFSFHPFIPKMSRKTGSKDKTKPHAPPTTTTPSVSEIIPGKFTETDWNGVLLLDENEDFIGSFVEEIISNVDMRIREIEIERQLAPYTVNKVMKFVHNMFKLAYPEHQVVYKVLLFSRIKRLMNLGSQILVPNVP